MTPRDVWRRGKVAPFAAGLALTLLGAGGLAAQGHGPVYGLSTPTLGKGGWSLDIGTMGRFFDGRRTVMVRPMLGYGLSEDLQATLSVPVPLARDPSAPVVRGFTRMPATRDVEVGLGWRLQRRGTGVGARQESTLWLAVDQPLDDTRGGVETSPGVFAGLVTGYASRTVYVWTGAAYRRFAGADGDRTGDSRMGSLVVGYRPPWFQEDYPSPDWRGFVEVVGEWTREDVVDGRELPGTGGRQVFLAFTVLGLYGSWGLAGGPALPVYQDMNGSQLEESVRFAANVTFWW